MLAEQNKFKTLFSKEQIQDRIRQMGQQISKRFSSKDNLTFVCILKGSFLFYSDLIRHIDKDIQCDFVATSDHWTSTKRCDTYLTLDLSTSIEDRNVVLVTEIVATGITLEYLRNLMLLKKPKSITTVTLLLKSDFLKIKDPIDHVGFEIKDQCVVGYGLEYKGYFRNLPYIAQVQGFN